ncbi:MAG TPA: hypothetical protein DIT13_02380 [Verrucomicrobiales bacterium]|nr:hypothetical protein [Verrucomicrobiales bacterium]HRJ07152.1 hypothetical protein [Prosthecobacter sp.]HRK13339.1 hypothetical protein [Prosthecobacter sp.]
MPQLSPTPIPDSWRQDVIRILKSGDSRCIEWTVRARSDWSVFGISHKAYEHLIQTLSTPALIGRQVLFMDGRTEVWEFLCPHPLGIVKPLYAKIGLKEGRLNIKIFSTHIDLTGELQTAIQRLHKPRKR